jgi:NAD(P)-dependent dehydrogenase (short-subunit alcohol dehydrogenase family)
VGPARTFTLGGLCVRRLGIRSNVVQPGFIETDLTAPIQSNPIAKKKQSSVLKKTILLRRSGKAEEIAYTPGQR